ncbi:MAG TPA: hypothetical protein ENH87_05540 [Pricia antarctica]|uniref:Viral A-type inclusion protein n=2 Tax=root TaxID=1 RepID=A0A831QPF3_9FLAO|nr:hypothetical protein [Pricia antarctica]
MRPITILAFMAIATIVISCKGKEESTQMNHVMAVHDEVMPKMGQLGKLVAELKAMENDSTEIGKQYKTARIELQEANEAMMDWMQNFGNRFTPDEILNGAELSEQKKQWLNEEEVKTKALRNQINASIENAKNLLDK